MKENLPIIDIKSDNDKDFLEIVQANEKKRLSYEKLFTKFRIDLKIISQMKNTRVIVYLH